MKVDNLEWNRDSEKWARSTPNADPNPQDHAEDDELLDVKKDADLVFNEGPDRVVHFTDYLLNKSEAKSSHKTFNCAFKAFDEKLEGIQTGEVVVVSGYTKNGKTLFAESWIHEMAKRDPQAKVAIFSFEVQTEKLLVKYMRNETLPLFVPMSLKTMDFDWLKDRCREARLKHNVNIVLIDHLHFLVDMNTKQNMSLNIGAFMRRLKHEIAIGLNMAVILIAHQGQPRDGKEASLGGIRDSSFISQEADTVIIVTRRENYSSVELKDFEIKFGDDKLHKIMPPPDNEDKYSAGLALVKIECARRTGAFDYKKLFKKSGEFLEEI